MRGSPPPCSPPPPTFARSRAGAASDSPREWCRRTPLELVVLSNRSSSMPICARPLDCPGHQLPAARNGKCDVRVRSAASRERLRGGAGRIRPTPGEQGAVTRYRDARRHGVQQWVSRLPWSPTGRERSDSSPHRGLENIPCRTLSRQENIRAPVPRRFHYVDSALLVRLHRVWFAPGSGRGGVTAPVGQWTECAFLGDSRG